MMGFMDQKLCLDSASGNSSWMDVQTDGSIIQVALDRMRVKDEKKKMDECIICIFLV